MLGFLDGAELWIVLGIVVLLFGGAALPKLARGMGEAQREFKKGLAEGNADKNDAAAGDK
jgi:sec-independent protein translocase protein TatA